MDNERQTEESTYYQSICFPRIGALAACLHGQDGLLGRLWSGVIGASSSLALSPYKSRSMMQLLPLLVASLGQLPPAIGRARATLHTLYTARGMAGYCTRMAFEGVLK